MWHFPETCEGLFQDYVNTWLKIKQEASGWPQWVGDDETKRQLQCRSAATGQNDVKFHLGQVRATSQQDPQAFHRFLDSESLDVRHVSVVNDYLMEAH